MGAPTLELPHLEVVEQTLRQRRAAEPLVGEAALVMICMDTRPGDPECAVLGDDHALNLVRHPGGLSGAGRRVSGAWATDDPKEYKEYSQAAHLNGLRLAEPLGELGIFPSIHFDCKDNKVAKDAAELVADRDPDVLEIAQEMDHNLSNAMFARVAGGKALMLEMGHIADTDTVIEDYTASGIAIARLHGDALRGISLVDNHSTHLVKAPPKRHKPEHDHGAIYVTDTGLVIPRLTRAARQGLSNQIQPDTVRAGDTIHKAALVYLLDLPYVTIT